MSINEIEEQIRYFKRRYETETMGQLEVLCLLTDVFEFFNELLDKNDNRDIMV